MDKRIIAALDAQIRDLQHARKVLAGLNLGSKVAKSGKATGRRKMSAAGRRRISLAQRARWKKWKAAKKSA